MKKHFWIAGLCCGLVAGLSSAATVQTGQEFVYKPVPAGGPEMVWYLVDWGDGTVTPTWHGLAAFSPEMPKVWSRPGTFKIQPQAITVSGKNIPLKGGSVTVAGAAVKNPVPLPAKSSDAPQATEEPRQPQSYTIHFDRIEPVDRLELAKESGAAFPDNFCVEVSTDGGKVWNDIPAAAYSHFPDPGNKKVCIPLHGLSASDLRVTSYKPPVNAGGKYELRMKEPVAFGGEKLFSMDANPLLEADWNNMWLTYGSAANEVLHNFDPWWPTDRPDEGGLLGIGSTIWAHWNAMKVSWLNDPASKKYYEECVNAYPQDERGLMGVAPGTFYHLDHSKHHVTPAIFISGISHWYLMHRDPAFLQTKDAKTGATLIEKVRKAMKFQLEDMDGKTGLMTIHDPQNDGTATGLGGNYWDGWRFGYRSAYCNNEFYISLYWMAQLETALGNADKAAEYMALRPLVKQRYNEVFWNEETGRFIGCEGKDGSRHDYGFTFVNLQAVASGVATDEHAKKILQWLDGERIVKGDTSTGADIYYWKVSPRCNTLAAEAIKPSFWDNWTMEVGPGTIGEYGKQIQNGGHIFYVSHYDLMSRLRTTGIDAAMKRMDVILDEFHKDQLHRKPSNEFGITHVEGILREFPESGLVPLFMLTGIMGIEPEATGLRIEPSLPTAWNYAAVTEYWFAGKKYSIRAARGLKQPEVNGTAIKVPAEGRWLLKPEGEVIKW